MTILRLIALGGLGLFPALSQYVYDYPNVFDPTTTSQWTLNGGGALCCNSFEANNVGSGIFKPSLPTPSNGYEVNATLPVYWWGDIYVMYLRASSNANGDYYSYTGTTYAMTISAPYESSQQPATTCSVNLAKVISGTTTTLLGTSIPCHNNFIVRAVVTQSNWILLYVDNVLYVQVSDASISSGQPGVGASSSSIYTLDIGHQDTVPPIPVNASTIRASAQPNQVDLQWGATTDDPNGIGLLEYSIYRNGSFLGSTPVTTTTFADYTARPNAAYTYTINAVDQHLNQVGTSYDVTTPPLTTVVPKIGVRPVGSYWGGDGEQIDLVSGNLNYTMSILKAMGRGGWGVNFQLSYNSQNWREDSGGTWQLGLDTGYGYGWRLQAGSMTPVYSGTWTIDHYLFIDSTGAQHSFNVNSSNIWTSTDSLYLRYDANANILHFPDGSFWSLGSTSSGLEQDAGTMYPTLMEDSNGNQLS